MNRIKKAYILAAMLLLFCLSGCANQSSTPKIHDAKAEFTGMVMDGHVDENIDFDLNEAVIAVEVSTITEAAAREAYPNAEYLYVNSAPDGFLAVQSGKADAFAVTTDTFYSSTAAGHTGLRIHSDGVVGSPGKIAAVVSRATGIPDARQKMNDFLAELEADGTLEDMKRRWIVEQNYDVPEIPKPEHPEYTIKIGTTGLAQPYSFYQNNELTGFDVELMQRFALWCNAELEIKSYNWEGIYEEGTPEQVFLHPKKDKTRAFVKRLKVLSLSVKSADFDFIAMSEALQNFGQKHMLTQKRTTNMRRIFEEILALNLIPNGSPAFPLELTAEYAEETDTLQMRLRWAGPEYDPLAQGDELPLKLGRTAVTDSQFTYEDGENLLVLTL